MSGSVRGIGLPRCGTSLISACSLLLSPNNSAAFAACGLVSFIWPRMAPVISTGDMPPISPQMYFQVQPFSRLMSRSFSVSSARDFVDVMDDLLLAPRLRSGSIESDQSLDCRFEHDLFRKPVSTF